jgi:hypothetical protein
VSATEGPRARHIAVYGFHYRSRCVSICEMRVRAIDSSIANL